MPSKSQKIRLGIFIILSLAAVVVLLAIVTSQKFLQKQDTYFIAYQDVSVSGLEEGSPVKYLGISVGTIKEIKIDPQDVSRIIVEIGLEPGTPIKEDAHADIAAIGITGLKMIEIRGGSNEASLLKPNDFIPAGSSITEEITGKAEVIAEKLELVLNNLNQFTKPSNLNKFSRLVENIDSTNYKLNQILSENQVGIRKTISYSDLVMARIDTISEILIESATKIQGFAIVDTVAEILSNVNTASTKLKEANLVELILRLSQIVERTNRLLITMESDLQRGGQHFFVSMQKLKSTLEYLNETARIVNEDPSILLRGTSFENVPDKSLEKH